MIAGKNVLVVEDQMMIAFALAAILEDHGMNVIGPFAQVDEAIDAIGQTEIDLAFLDVNLGNDVTSEMIAHALSDRDVPFVFVTGYGSASAISEDFQSVKRYIKPLTPDHVAESLSVALS